MTDEENVELQILNNCFDLINSRADEVIKGLTQKALVVRMEETDRIALLGRREGLMNFVQSLGERRRILVEKKQKER